MKLLKKRESFVSNMAFMGIVAAIITIINSLAALADLYIPIVGLVISFVLPILVLGVEVSCETKYFPLFFSVTLLLSVITTLWNLQSTFYYLISSLCSGFIFGYSIKKKIPLIFVIILSSIVQGLLIFAFSRLVVVFFGIDTIEIILRFLQLSESFGGRLMVLPTIFVFALIQMSFTALISSFEIKRFGLEFIDEEKRPLGRVIVLLVTTLLIIPGAFIWLPLAYILLMIAFYFAVSLIIKLIKEKRILSLILTITFFLFSFFIFAILNREMPAYTAMLLFGILPLLIGVTNLLDLLLKKKSK